jgi:hypothetical protein
MVCLAAVGWWGPRSWNVKLFGPQCWLQGTSSIRLRRKSVRAEQLRNPWKTNVAPHLRQMPREIKSLPGVEGANQPWALARL